MTTRTITLEDIKPGDILVDVWGYSMRIVSYYQVTRRTAQRVYVKEIESKEVNDGGFLTGTSTPVKNSFKATNPTEPVEYQAQLTKSGNYLTSSLNRLEPHFLEVWDGKPKHYDHCD